MFVRHIAVPEYYDVHTHFLDQLSELTLGFNGNPVRIARPSKLCRVSSVIYVGDLGRRERYDLVIRIVTEMNVEIVKITSRGPKDENALRHTETSCTGLELR
jgi:hypothetical protein